MSPKILYIMSSYNLYGGTPKKTLDLMNHFGSDSALYVYEDSYANFKSEFECTNGKIYEGFYGRNIFKHVRKLIEIIDHEKINIIQTQFSMGEFLGYLVKKFRPHVKLVIAFVSSIQPSGIKSNLVGKIYKKADALVFISDYVRIEKIKQFPILSHKQGFIIYNGSKRREDNGVEAVTLNKYSVLAISGLIDLKNIQILIEAFHIIVNTLGRKNISLYVAGDGPKKNELHQQIEKFALNEQIHLVGYQKNVGRLLNNCDVFVHPSYDEGFGIVVAEAMLNQKPIIVSSAGALPELIDHEVNGLIADPFDALNWAQEIIRLLDDIHFSEELALKAKIKAETEFSYEKFVLSYGELYQDVLNKEK